MPEVAMPPGAPAAPSTPTPMRTADTLTAPVVNMPSGACDTHCHVFEPGYPHIATPKYTFPDGSLTQYLAMADVLGIDRMVLVQPTYYGEDNSLALNTVAKLGDRARAVVVAPDDVDTAALEPLDRAGARALRLDLFARPAWRLDDIREYIARMAMVARPLGWHLQVYAPGSTVLDLIPLLAEVEVPIVIDHMAYLKPAEGFGEAHTERLVGLLDSGNCWVKLTSPYRIAGDQPMSSIALLGRALVGARPDRLLWGTDWPHLPDGQRDTGELVTLLSDWAPDPADRRSILVDSPGRLFFAH